MENHLPKSVNDVLEGAQRTISPWPFYLVEQAELLPSGICSHPEELINGIDGGFELREKSNSLEDCPLEVVEPCPILL